MTLQDYGGSPRVLVDIYCARNAVKGLHAQAELADEVVIRDNMVYDVLDTCDGVCRGEGRSPDLSLDSVRGLGQTAAAAGLGGFPHKSSSL